MLSQQCPIGRVTPRQLKSGWKNDTSSPEQLSIDARNDPRRRGRLALVSQLGRDPEAGEQDVAFANPSADSLCQMPAIRFAPRL